MERGCPERAPDAPLRQRVGPAIASNIHASEIYKRSATPFPVHFAREDGAPCPAEKKRADSGCFGGPISFLFKSPGKIGRTMHQHRFLTALFFYGRIPAEASHPQGFPPGGSGKRDQERPKTEQKRHRTGAGAVKIKGGIQNDL